MAVGDEPVEREKILKKVYIDHKNIRDVQGSNQWKIVIKMFTFRFANYEHNCISPKTYTLMVKQVI